MQECIKCGVNKPMTTEYYYAERGNTSGFRKDCKECRKKYQRARQEEYDENNREKIRERKRKYYERNRERLLEYSNNYHKNNREQRRKYYEKYHAENKEYFQRLQKEYRERNPEVKARQAQVRRARQAKVSHTLTEAEWEGILNEFGNECSYCGGNSPNGDQKLQQEHFVPLTSGGGYEVGNIIPACSYCNLRKHTKKFDEWYPTYEFYSQERELFLKAYLKSVRRNQ